MYNKATQPYIYLCPFTPKLPGCHITWSRVSCAVQWVLVGYLFYICYRVSVNPSGCCSLGPRDLCPSAVASWHCLPFPFLPHPLQLPVIVSHPISLDRLFPKNDCRWCSSGWPWGEGVTAESASLWWVHRPWAGLPADGTSPLSWGILAGAWGPAQVPFPLLLVFRNRDLGTYWQSSSCWSWRCQRERL